MKSNIFCEYCEEEMSEEKGEIDHGCLTCHQAPWVARIDELKKENKRLQEDVTAHYEAYKYANIRAIDEVREIKAENEKLKKMIKEMLDETAKKNLAERKLKGLRDGEFIIDGYFRLNQIHYELNQLVNDRE